MEPLELAGQRFGRMHVIARVENKLGKSCWQCRCDCGTVKVVFGSMLTRGTTASCGCWNKEITSALFSGDKSRHPRAYKIWQLMKDRCTNPRSRPYKYYGGRGIRVCERWLESFSNFYADMGDPPPELTLERIDNNGNYEPSNTRWATRKEQSQNRNYKRTLTYNGETLLLTEWATRLGINSRTLRSRVLQHHWPIEKALNTP